MSLVGFVLVICLALIASSGAGVVGFLAAWAIVSVGVMIGGVAVGMMGFARALPAVAENQEDYVDLDDATDVVMSRINLWMYLGALVGGLVAMLLASVVI